MNSTYYDWHEKKLYWRIEWIFFGSSGEVKLEDSRYRRCLEQNDTFSFLFIFAHMGRIIIVDFVTQSFR